MEKRALVLGGGISGIQAALDLANAQVKVFLLEKSPSIGGTMAKLDKTFPTNDCSMCILSPKLVEAGRHPNITIMTNSELVELDGDAGNFKAKIRHLATFVDEDKCIGCGICAEKCPVKVPNEFDMSLGNRKAIYIPFPQAVPLKYRIDKDHCTYFKTGKCKACLKFCPDKAPDFDQKDETIDLEIGAVVVAPGFESYIPSDRGQYGYGEYKDVITSLEFERILSPSGPTNGQVLKRSDGKPAESIVFIQCVGSRNNNNGKPYCSRVCCMYSVKEALIAKEHSENIKDLTILYTDIRAFGKNFEQYYHRARYEEGINFIRGYSAEIKEDPETKKLVVFSENTLTGDIKRTSADLVVLATAVLPAKDNGDLAEKLNIELDDYGFFKQGNPSVSLVDSTRKGIYLAGCSTGPRDIPDSVTTASAAASSAVNDLENLGHIQSGSHQVLPEGVGVEEPRIGVFVCHCGTNIGSVVDVESVADYAKTLPYVVYTDSNLFTCSDATQQQIKEEIKTHNLNRVVVASCTPRTHEPLFQETLLEGGLNPYLFEMANIREHCSWVHKEDHTKATDKAKELVRMAVAKSSNLTELVNQTFELEHSAAVVGGGIAGIQAALDLARKGIKTYMIEKEGELGGRLRQLNRTARTDIKTNEILDRLLSELESLKSGVTIFKSAELTSVKGFLGNYELTINSGNKNHDIKAGAVIIATGAKVYDPSGTFGYGKYKHVMTNLELERSLNKAGKVEFKFGKPKKAVYILCVGSRTLGTGIESSEGKENNGSGYPKEDGSITNPGCSRLCCNIGIKQSLELAREGIDTTLLYRDIRTFDSGSEEQYYQAAVEGIKFIRYDQSRQPELSADGSTVDVFDTVSGENLSLAADLIVLGCGLVPDSKDAKQLQSLFKIPRSPDGFFLEAHPKLAPLETTTGGIYLSGTSVYPKGIAESAASGSGAALKAAVLLSQDSLAAEASTAIVDSSICWGCGTCVDICVYGAPGLKESENGSSLISYINPTLCKGCGACAARCPSGAINANLFTDRQLLAMVKALGGDLR